MIKSFWNYLNSDENKSIFNNLKNNSNIEQYLKTFYQHISRLNQKTKYKSDIMLDNLVLQRTSTLERSLSRAKTCDMGPTISRHDLTSHVCKICFGNTRDVLFNCGHCMCCKSCVKQILFNIDEDDEKKSNISPIEFTPINNFFELNDKIKVYTDGKCPICREKIRHLRIINFIPNEKPFKCMNTDCLNNAVILSVECNHLNYCNICMNKNKKDLTCKCNAKINKYIQIFDI